MGVNTDGRRELLGLKVGDSESEGFWSEFLGSLKERGLTGVKLVVSEGIGLTTTAYSVPTGIHQELCRYRITGKTQYHRRGVGSTAKAINPRKCRNS